MPIHRNQASQANQPKQTLRPPIAENPIVIGPSIPILAEIEVLNEFSEVMEEPNVDAGAKCALAALARGMDAETVQVMVHSVSNEAGTRREFTPAVTRMLLKAVDAGYLDHAYNAGNRLLALEDYKRAEHYFKIAMAYADEPRLQAAAYVNYCPIVRDGLITGKPDWPAAVELYEKAAAMGLVKGMFNAGNVSSWLWRKGSDAYGERAAKWFKTALDHVALDLPTLDMEEGEALQEVVDDCKCELAACHIDARFAGADVEEGVRLISDLAAHGKESAQEYLRIAYMRRIAKMSAEPVLNSPGENWRSVLSQMNWRFRGSVSRRRIALKTAEHPRYTWVDEMEIELANGQVFPLVVAHEPGLPFRDGIKRMCLIAQNLDARHTNGFFLLARKGIFIAVENQCYTPIYVRHAGHFSQQSLWFGCTPDLLIQNGDKHVSLVDKRFGNGNCMIPIAANALDEGYVVATNTAFAQPCVSVGEKFQMPYVNPDYLEALGIDTSGMPPNMR